VTQQVKPQSNCLVFAVYFEKDLCLYSAKHNFSAE